MAENAGNEEYSVAMPLRLYFKTDEPVAIKEVADSLVAMEKLAKRIPIMLSQLSGIEIDTHQLSVERIESGSLLEALVLMVFLSTSDQQAALFKFLEQHPMGKPLKYGLAGLFALLLISEGYHLVTDFLEEDAPSIQGNHNTIITITADEMDVSEEALREALAFASGGNRKELARSALDVARPIAGHADASIHAEGAGSPISIPPEAVSEIPFEADLNAQEHDIDYENTLVQIRALDRDKTDSGWWGIMPVIGDKRLRLHFTDDVDADSITHRPDVHVDATVTYRNDINKAKLVPKHITITRIYPAERR